MEPGDRLESQSTIKIKDKKKTYQLVWSEGALSVTGPLNSDLQKRLSYQSKSLEQDPQRPWQRRVKRKTEHSYSREKNPDGTYTYLTMQGLLDTVISCLAQQPDCAFSFVDARRPFPKAKLSRMHGFRFDQERMTTQALQADRSGLVVAPTRYGKTAMICNTINAYPGLKTVVIAPGIDLLPQLEDAIRHYCPGREVKGIYTGSKNRIQSDDITVCSVDSIDKLDKAGTRLVLVDEPHAVATGPRSAELVSFECARFLGFGATVSGRWEGNDIIITGLFGPRLITKTYKEAVAEGAIAPIHVKFIRVPFVHWTVAQRATAYKKLHSSPAYLDTLSRTVNEIIPPDWQTLVFITNEKQGNLLTERIRDSVLAMDKTMKRAGERKELFERLKTGEINRCVCSNIYSTGVTIDGIRVAVNAAEGAAGILSVQKPGRLAEIKEGKVCGYMIDFLFECETPKERTDDLSYRQKAWQLVVNDCWARYRAYEEIGYDLEILDSPDDLVLI